MQANSALVRNQIRQDQIRIGLALAACRADQEKVSADTRRVEAESISPKCLSIDTSDKAAGVRPHATNGFLIYSIGANGQDDGGLMKSQGKEDDIPFEVPPKIDE